MTPVCVCVCVCVMFILYETRSGLVVGGHSAKVTTYK